MYKVDANELLDAYRELYYTGGTSSVYLWDLEDSTKDAFAGAFLIKKRTGEEGSKVLSFKIEK
jgi:capping protein (actin filament) muscle Z-line, beta